MLKSRQNSSKDIGTADEVLCEQYLPGVFQYISYWINSAQEAENLTLAVLKQALTRFDNCCKDQESFSAWVFTIARKAVARHVQTNWNKPGETPKGVAELALAFSDNVAGKKQWHRLQSGLASLSTQEMEVISLKFTANLDNARIAKILGLSEPVVKAKIVQALHNLRGCFPE